MIYLLPLFTATLLRFPDMAQMVEYGKSKGVVMGFYSDNCRCHEKGATHYPQDAHLAEALAGCSPPWQLSEVLTRLRAVGSDDLSGQEISAMADICSGVSKGTGLGDFVSGMLLGPS